MRQDIKDTIARLRYERDMFKSLSTQRRKDVARLRKARRFLDMIEAMGRMHEYAGIAKGRQAEIDRLKRAYTVPTA